MSDTTVSLSGNLAASPTLRHTASGVAVANFALACSRRHHDKDSGTWVDDEPLWIRGTVWRAAAEHVASLGKGTRVTVIGELVPNNWEDETGTRRSSIEVQASEVAVSLKFDAAISERTLSAARPTTGVPASSAVPF